MNSAENRAPDSTVSITPETTIASPLCNKPQKLIINCDKIILRDEGIEIVLNGKLNCADFKQIIINGITYIRATKRDDKDEPSLQYFGL